MTFCTYNAILIGAQCESTLVFPSSTNWQSPDASSNEACMALFIHYYLFRAIELPPTVIPATPMIPLSLTFPCYGFSHLTISPFF